MANFVPLVTNKEHNETIWVNADRVLYFKPAGPGWTTIHFEQDHTLSVNETVDRVILALE